MLKDPMKLLLSIVLLSFSSSTGTNADELTRTLMSSRHHNEIPKTQSEEKPLISKNQNKVSDHTYAKKPSKEYLVKNTMYGQFNHYN